MKGCMKMEKKNIDLTKMNQKELKEYKDLNSYLATFKDKTEEEAKKYIKENLYKLQISKGCIAAYLKTYHSGEDTEWFRKAAYVEKPVYKYTYETLSDGTPITKVKDGKLVYKKIKVVVPGETKVSYDHAKARGAFLQKFDIEVKATTFKAKPKKETEFDIFEGIL